MCNKSLLHIILTIFSIIKHNDHNTTPTPTVIHPTNPFTSRLCIIFTRDSNISNNITSEKIQAKYETCWEKMSRVLCPQVNIAAATKTALEILRGNNSIAYDIQAPPKSCPTKITCVQTRQTVTNAQKDYSADNLFSILDCKL